MNRPLTISNLAQLEAFAFSFVAGLASNNDKATVIGLRGELGSGKTAFTKAVAKILGLKNPVTSPTFVILKKYALTGQIFSHLIHIDAYRLKNSRELSVLGWSELLADKSNLIMIEWPEIVADIMPLSAKYLDFKHLNETTREIYER